MSSRITPLLKRAGDGVPVTEVRAAVDHACRTSRLDLSDGTAVASWPGRPGRERKKLLAIHNLGDVHLSGASSLDRADTPLAIILFSSVRPEKARDRGHEQPQVTG